MKWILDEQRECITLNAEPILEASFYNKDCLDALKLAQKAPEMKLILESIINLQEDCYGDGIKTHLMLLEKVKEIKKLLKDE